MTRLILLALAAAANVAHADPQLTSWFTTNSGQYARIYASATDEAAGTKSITWSRGTGVQSSPTYSDVTEINYSSNWIYIRTTGLASHMMGPWPTNFPNFPSNTATVYRIPRVPTIPGTKVATGLGATGRMVNGVSMFDSRDAFSYKGTPNFTDATPNGGFTGDGIWNRDGYHNEGPTFDQALAHQAGNNYHYHAQPIGLRYQLGDHVDYNATTNRYTESVGAVTKHSPILAWAADGLPVYGPYGYSDPDSAASGLRRMVSGFALRDGTNGTTAITVRESLPLWAQRIQNKPTLTAAQYGPAVTTTAGSAYLLGHYIEDFDYQGDLAGRVQTKGSNSVGGFVLGDYDLNEQNVRFCVTPEFPAGTWAYFTTITAAGTPTFPYTTGRQYYGTASGGGTTTTVMNADTPLTQHFIGGANTPVTISTPSVSAPNVTLTWSSVEGGTYSVDASAASNFTPFTSKATGLVATGISKASTYATLGSSGTEYARVNRTALATYDANGQTAATVSQSATTNYTLGPANSSPTITGIANQNAALNTSVSGIAFTVGDVETAAASLTVTGSSTNTTVLPNANITFGGSGANRTVTLTPATNQSGTATITISVNDGTSTTNTTFTFTVAPASNRNNILLIMADDYGLDASSLYNTSPGVSLPPTPNIASLAASGVKFTGAHAYALCSPTRSSILTGRFGFRTGTGNVVAAASNNSLLASEFTLPDAFAANSGLDYQLKHIGKWHLGGGQTAPCLIGGWPSFAGALIGEVTDFYNWTKVTGSGATASSTTSTTYATTENVNDALAFINSQTAAGKPWFTWLAFNAPHTPYHKPPNDLHSYDTTVAGWESLAITGNSLVHYNAAVEAMDTEIGRVLAGVDLNTTTVIFIGDNGTPTATLQAPYPASRGKATLYEGGVRVPMIIRGPNVVSPGRTAPQLVHVVDLYSTILELAGINVASTVPGGTVLDSQSLLPILQNQTVTRPQAYSELFDTSDATFGGHALRNSQYKVIRPKTGSESFYDLQADPYEATNLLTSGVNAMTAAQRNAYYSLVADLGTYSTTAATTINAVTLNPSVATSGDAVTVTANVTPAPTTSITSVNLTYDTGVPTTTTVFTETMGTAAGGFTTAANNGTNNAWTVNFAQPQPNGPFSFTTAANHGSGNVYGLEMNRGTPNLTDNYITTTSNIDASGGTSASIEFWVATANLGATNGWAFQTSTNGTTWTTRTTTPAYTAGTNQAYTLYHYDLSAGERVSTLKLRFQFAGNGPTNPASKISLDDIKVVTTSGSSTATLPMTAGSGDNYTAAIPLQATGTTVSYNILATDSLSGVDYVSSSYSVVTAAPALTVTPSTPFSSTGIAASGAFTPSSATYTLTNSGTRSMNWTAAKTATWLNLSSTGGTLAAGASATVTASINTANANALSAATYSDTISFNNTSNSAGNTTRAASLIIGTNSIPATPALTALPAYSQGSSKTIRWNSSFGATSYTLQVAANSGFTTILSSQTVTTPSVTLSNLASGVTYYYRVLAANSIGSSGYSNTVSSTQDDVAPAVAITSPSTAQTTATNTITLSGTSSDALSGISKVTVNGVTVTTGNGFATWSISVPLGFGTNSITALAIDNAGNTSSSAPLIVILTTAQTYNPLVIPDIITGTTFNLALKPQTKQFLTGTATNTNAYNDMLYGAPTLIMNKGDWVQMHVTNNLSTNPADATNDAFTTTTHWHGFHIPAIMDGGPHQTIPATNTWSPSWTVMNNAGTYWYHPHLHLKTQEQVSRGAVGMIIIRDTGEAALALPRTYGVDDIPLALGSRRFTANQIVTVNSAYGDTMLVNGVINPQVSLPKQYVRLRILNAEIERSLNLGFSDNRTFWVIATDGGLVDAPVATTRIVMGVGERYEILVDLSGDIIGTSIDLKAYNSSASLGTPLSNSFPGVEPGTTGQFGSLLNAVDFNILHINIAAQTASPILARPSSLTTNALWTDVNVTNPTTRTLNITGGAPGLFYFNTDQLYSPTVFNQTVNFNAVERWTITNTSGFSHSFHIHDIQFALISRVSAGAGPATVTGITPYETGWKDTLYVQRNSSVTFIAKFDHFASSTNPFMYHCHFANHEDEGLMGQFIVQNNATEDLSIANFERTSATGNLISLDFKTTPGTTYALQYSTDLSTWVDIDSVTSDGSSANFTETDSNRLGSAKGFYRIKVPTVP